MNKPKRRRKIEKPIPVNENDLRKILGDENVDHLLKLSNGKPLPATSISPEIINMLLDHIGG